MSSLFFSSGPSLPADEDLTNLRFERIKPRMSLHRLAQFDRSNVHQRRKAITTEKHPSFYRMRHDAAHRLFGEALRLGWSGDELFASARERWLDESLESRFAIRQRDAAIEAAAHFASMIDVLRAELASCGVRVAVAKTCWRPLVLGGVQVVDTTPIILRRVHRGVLEEGLLSFHVSKGRPHNTDDARMAAVLLYELAGVNIDLLGGGVIEPRLCVAVDVFSGAISDADYGRKRRMRWAQLACEEIASQWSVI